MLKDSAMSVKVSPNSLWIKLTENLLWAKDHISWYILLCIFAVVLGSLYLISKKLSLYVYSPAIQHQFPFKIKMKKFENIHLWVLKSVKQIIILQEFIIIWKTKTSLHIWSVNLTIAIRFYNMNYLKLESKLQNQVKMLKSNFPCIKLDHNPEGNQ